MGDTFKKLKNSVVNGWENTKEVVSSHFKALIGLGVGGLSGVMVVAPTLGEALELHQKEGDIQALCNLQVPRMRSEFEEGGLVLGLIKNNAIGGHTVIGTWGDPVVDLEQEEIQVRFTTRVTDPSLTYSHGCGQAYAAVAFDPESIEAAQHFLYSTGDQALNGRGERYKHGYVVTGGENGMGAWIRGAEAAVLKQSPF